MLKEGRAVRGPPFFLYPFDPYHPCSFLVMQISLIAQKDLRFS